MAPSVYVSGSLRSVLSTSEVSDLIAAFAWWKTAESRLYDSPVFGKDSKTLKPTVHGQAYVMSHCHLAPKNSSEDKARWLRDFRRRARKTSDRVLFYVQDGARFFLIDIVDDPGAHEIMRMTDKQGKTFMLKCAEQAEAFLDGRLALTAS